MSAETGIQHREVAITIRKTRESFESCQFRCDELRQHRHLRIQRDFLADGFERKEFIQGLPHR